MSVAIWVELETIPLPVMYPPHEPEIPAAVKVLIKVAFAPKEPEILSAIWVDEETIPLPVMNPPHEPEIPAAVKVLIRVAFAPKEPETSSFIWVELLKKV